MGRTESPDKALFTKDGKLKKELGTANKGWYLITIKDSRADTSADALAEAKNVLVEMYTNAEAQLQSMKFIFGRRTLKLD